MLTGHANVAVTGMGVITSVATDVRSFSNSLRNGISGISNLRNLPVESIDVKIGAEIPAHDWQECLQNIAGVDPSLKTRARKLLNRAPPSTRLSVCVAAQALAQAGLLNSHTERTRIGLVVAGSNIHQCYIHENAARFRESSGSLNPSYALSFLDSSQVGVISELFGIHGIGYTVGGASASGSVALYQAWQWIRLGVLDACVVIGASADYSEIELQAFSLLGAACGAPLHNHPEKACRPFDRDRAGFVFGEGSGCVILENETLVRGRGANSVGQIKGASFALDGNSLPNPSLEGEIRAMKTALGEAGVEPADIGYLNAHGTSSILGDEVECAAITSVFENSLRNVVINSTKSLTGHCMSAAGVIEFIATLIQLNEAFVHPNLNLENPLTDKLNFAGLDAQPLNAQFALSNAFGFGGFNSSVVLARQQS